MYIMPSPCFASTVGVVPGAPSDVVVTEATKSYVVLGWKPPVQRGHEGVMYYIEKVRGKDGGATVCCVGCVFSTEYIWMVVCLFTCFHGLHGL